MINRVTFFLEHVLNIGVRPDNVQQENKRIRLINRLSFLGVIGFGLWSLSYAFDGIGITSTEALIPVFPYLFIIYLNHLGKYELARYLHYIFTTLVFTYYGVAHGAKDGAEYFLFIVNIMGLMYFDKIKSLAILFVFNFSCFWFIKYTHTIMNPPIESGHVLFVPNLISVFIMLFLVAYYFKRENRLQEELLAQKNESLAAESAKSRELLLNILPKMVADELIATGKNIPRSYDSATVMFTDFKNFTQITRSMAPEKLVEMVNDYFVGFDNIIKRYNIEKIKTIGDSYLCVAGIPVENETHARDAVEVAIALQEYMELKKIEALATDQMYFELRIGIHTNSVIAGVVGETKFVYDVWGDTVNTASRMESTCEAGKINISETTYRSVKNFFTCQKRGRIEAKHMGELEMYYVSA